MVQEAIRLSRRTTTTLNPISHEKIQKSTYAIADLVGLLEERDDDKQIIQEKSTACKPWRAARFRVSRNATPVVQI